MIDKYLLLTLEKSKRRQQSVFGAARAMEVPENKAHFFIGYDNLDFDNDISKVVESAEAEGYPFVKYFACHVHTTHIRSTIGSTCQYWNVARMLQYISDTDITALISWDDRMVTVPFPIIEKMADELQNRSEPFYLCQLRLRSYNDLDVATYNGHTRDDSILPIYDPDITAEMFHRTVRGFVNSYYDTFFNKGIVGYDESMIISPLGARWILEQMQALEDIDFPDGIILDYSYLSREEALPDIRCRVNIDTWVAWGLYDALEEAKRLDLGIYCPKHVEFSFMRDWLPMGSSINWSKYEDLADDDTDLNYLEIL